MSADSAQIVRVRVQSIQVRSRDHHGESIWSQGLNIEWSLKGFDTELIYLSMKTNIMSTCKQTDNTNDTFLLK